MDIYELAEDLSQEIDESGKDLAGDPSGGGRLDNFEYDLFQFAIHIFTPPQDQEYAAGCHSRHSWSVLVFAVDCGTKKIRRRTTFPHSNVQYHRRGSS